MTSATGFDLTTQRLQLVELFERQGIRDPAVLRAMATVPREAFLPPELHEFAYRNAPLPIAHGQTISQPSLVAFMVEAMELEQGDRVLEVGTGSGYAAAVLSRIAQEVYTVERYRDLADTARARLQEAGFYNVCVLHANGTVGWPDEAPYDAIAVAAGGPGIPEALVRQLRVGGRLVIPVGREPDLQRLIRVRKTSEEDYEKEDLGEVRFVPLVGAAGWEREEREEEEWELEEEEIVGAAVLPVETTAERLAEAVEPFDTLEDCQLDTLMDRIGETRLVLIGEATHGTSEFYRMRARITRQLIAERDFRFVAVEADWPDAARVNRYVQHREEDEAPRLQAFARFPNWMWRNHEVLDFVEWLREYNQHRDAERRVGFYGLDLYSLFASVHAVLEYLDRVDQDAAQIARERYGCLTPWEGCPEVYGRAAISGRYRECEADAVAMLKDLLQRQTEYSVRDGERYFDAAQNAKLVADAERYYRVMYYGGVESWNLRDQHMFDTLQSLLEYHGPGAKGIVWAHNSHLGNAAATEMGASGETNVGELCRIGFSDDAYLIGQATDHGTVAAASRWDAEMQIMHVRPSREESYERLCHESGIPRFFLPLRDLPRAELRNKLASPRLERAIGVIYRPLTELESHYFRASLPAQFDELIWFEESHAVRPLLASDLEWHQHPHPFALID